MAGKLTEILEKGRTLWSKIAIPQRIFIVAFSAAVIAVFIGLVVW